MTTKFKLRIFCVITFLLSTTVAAQNNARPAVLKSLEDEGIKVVQEFEIPGDKRAFAGTAGMRPVAIYVSKDGTAIIGTRVDSKAKALDEAQVEELALKPMGERMWEQLQVSTWIQDGHVGAPKLVFTFSDPNCPYCNRFWQAARPWVDSGKVQIRHIMVGIIKEDSASKAAAMLQSANPAAALKKNESNYSKGGIKPATHISDKTRKALGENQILMARSGFTGTPAVVYRDDKGMVQRHNGLPTEAQMTAILGPK